MWEDANRKQPPQPGAAAGGRAKKDRRRRAADLVLWVQILLCLAALGAAVAAKHLQWPVYRPLRTAFYRALEAPGLPLLDSERRLVRFTQQTAAKSVNFFDEIFKLFQNLVIFCHVVCLCSGCRPGVFSAVIPM